MSIVIERGDVLGEELSDAVGAAIPVAAAKVAGALRDARPSSPRRNTGKPRKAQDDADSTGGANPRRMVMAIAWIVCTKFCHCSFIAISVLPYLFGSGCDNK